MSLSNPRTGEVGNADQSERLCTSCVCICCCCCSFHCVALGNILLLSCPQNRSKSHQARSQLPSPDPRLPIPGLRLRVFGFRTCPGHRFPATRIRQLDQHTSAHTRTDNLHAFYFSRRFVRAVSKQSSHTLTHIAYRTPIYPHHHPITGPAFWCAYCDRDRDTPHSKHDTTFRRQLCRRSVVGRR